ncbi:hypothetical protein [Pedobacter insulae]|uniref:MBG domain-containing protein n=1 Tax=Pedobacter insulae TaxID=414048 RepID=A0A1I2ZB49_9SPHI|nr:hypothetical protein [Pedobacter insulae]SFH35004.1 hypothetical protein SAMN04489864_109122 [Pedobacter insulae]
METKTTFLKSSLLALFLLISTTVTVFADTYYVCSGAALTLTDPPVDANLTYTWDVKLNNVSVPYPGSPGKPTSMPAAAGIYTVTLTSNLTPAGTLAGVCAPETGEYNVIVLPPLALTIDAPTKPSYCGVSANSESVVSLTGTAPSLPTNVVGPPAAPYSSDLELEYSYSVVKTVGAVVSPAVDGATIGTINQTTGAYTLTTDAVGSYAITGTVKYKQKAGFANTLLGTTGCPATSGTQTVVVTAAPAAPTITITAP